MSRSILFIGIVLVLPVIVIAQPMGPPAPTPLGFTELILGAALIGGVVKKYKSKN